MLLLFGLQLLGLPPLLILGGGLFVLRFVAPNREWSPSAIVTAATVALLSGPGAFVAGSILEKTSHIAWMMGDEGWLVLAELGVPVLVGSLGLCLVWATSTKPAR